MHKLCLLLGAMSLVGCTQTMESEKVDRHKLLDASTNGLEDQQYYLNADAVVYALPMRIMSLKITGAKPADLKKVADKVESAKAEVKIAKKALTTAKSTLEALKKTDGQGTGAGKDKAVATAETELFKAQAEAGQKQESLDSAEEALNSYLSSNLGVENEWVYSVKLELSKSLPDPEHMYQARYKHSLFRDDDFKITTTETGLLSSSNVEADDKSSEIIVNLAGILGSFPTTPLLEKFSVPMDMAPLLQKKPQCTLPSPPNIHIDFDPANQQQVDKINADLYNCEIPIRLNVRPPWEPSHPSNIAVASYPYDYSYKLGKLDGLLYRRPIPYITEVFYGCSRADPTLNSAVSDAKEAVQQLTSDIKNKDIESEETQKIFKDTIQTLRGFLKSINQFATNAGLDVTREAFVHLEDAETAFAKNPAGSLKGTEKAKFEMQKRYEILQALKAIKLHVPSLFLHTTCLSTQSTIAMLPQGGPLAAIPYRAAPFTKSVTNVVFKEGQPTEWHVNRPSELAAVFRIPLAVAKALVEIPASIVKLKVDYSSDKAALIEAQQKYICALEAVQKNADGTNSDSDINCGAD